MRYDRQLKDVRITRWLPVFFLRLSVIRTCADFNEDYMYIFRVLEQEEQSLSYRGKWWKGQSPWKGRPPPPPKPKGGWRLHFVYIQNFNTGGLGGSNYILCHKWRKHMDTWTHGIKSKSPTSPKFMCYNESLRAKAVLVHVPEVHYPLHMIDNTLQHSFSRWEGWIESLTLGQLWRIISLTEKWNSNRVLPSQ